MVYVDALINYPNAWGPFKKGSCHLVADSIDELHDFAKRLGLKRSWFQAKSRPHYDLTPGKRKRAVRLGAEEVDRAKFVRLARRLSEEAG